MTVLTKSRQFVDGERLSRDEFLDLWEAMPEVKNVELIDGVVYVASPVGVEHGDETSLADFWLGYYALFTPGCQVGTNGTWLMPNSAPQPDVSLRILPEYGGQTSIERKLGAGAPELVIEVALSSTDRDLGAKSRLYEASGVPEYVAILLKRPQVLWRRLVLGRFQDIEPGKDGIFRSHVFPGLWLDPEALLTGDRRGLVDVLELGLKSPEHAKFADELERHKRLREC